MGRCRLQGAVNVEIDLVGFSLTLVEDGRVVMPAGTGIITFDVEADVALELDSHLARSACRRVAIGDKKALGGIVVIVRQFEDDAQRRENAVVPKGYREGLAGDVQTAHFAPSAGAVERSGSTDLACRP